MLAAGWWCLAALVMIMKGSRPLQLQKVENNPGLLPVKQGQAFKQENKWIIVKKLDLSIIFDDLEFNIVRYSEFSKLINVDKPYAHEFLNLKLQVEYLRDSTIEKVKQISPTTRFRRGLINPIGSFIKAITGNLDNEDAIHYENLINKLYAKQNLFESKITLVSKMMDGFINSTEILYNNSLIMDVRLKRVEKMLKEIDTKENNSIYSTYILGLYSMFINNFRSIYIKINEIETALAFSKISVLHQSIVNSTELLYELSCIEKVHSLIYPVIEYNLVKLEQTLTIKAYIKGNQITFIMEVPLTDNNTYNYYKMYSLPILDQLRDETSIIIPEYPFLMVKGSKYLPVASPCQQISADDQYICKEDNVVTFSTLTCMEQLMQFQTNLSICSRRVVQMEEMKVQRLSSDSWIVYSRRNAVMSYKCGNDISKTTILGTYLVRIEPSCEIILGDIHLYYLQHTLEKFDYKVTPIFDLPDVKSKDMTTTAAEPMDIKGINLDEIKYLSAVLKTKSDSESESEIVKIKSVSLGTLILYLVLVTLSLFFIFKMFKKRFYEGRNPRILTSSDDFELKEGGVMLPAPRLQAPAPRLETVAVNADVA